MEWERDYDAGIARLQRGELDGAEENLKASLATIERFTGKEDFRYVKSLTGIATVYYAADRLEDAGRLYKEAAGLAQEVAGLDVVDQSAPLHGMASVEYASGDYGLCEQHARIVISQREDALSCLSHTDEAFASLSGKLRGDLGLLRDCLKKQSKVDEASRIEQRIAQME